MKILHLLLVAATIIILPACEEPKTPGQKIGNAIDDALDKRPGEKALDAAEDTRDAIKNATRDVKDAVKDATN
jgi:hypothetical protein